MAPSITQGASSRSWRRAAMNVWVFQWPKGAWSISRVPLGDHPVVLTMFVFSEVSSMKPMRVNRLRMNGWRRVIQIWRACRILGRFCSTACRSFFVFQPETAQEPPDRDTVNGDAVLISQFAHQIVQRKIRLRVHPRRDPALHGAQFAMPTAIALGAGFQPARLALQDHHVVNEFHRNPEPRRGCAVRMPFLHKRNNTFTKCHRMWFAHH